LRAILPVHTPVLAGIDVGNGRVKVATNVVGCESFEFQSIAAPSATIGEAIHGAGSDRRVSVDGTPWTVGLSPNAVDWKPSIHKGAHLSDAHHALFLGALNRIGRDIDIAIVGMTVDQAADKAMVAKLKDRLIGSHDVGNGTVHVDRVGIVPQPRGTTRLYIESILDDIVEQSVAILDFGEGSFDANRVVVSVDDDGVPQIRIDPKASMAEWIGVYDVSQKVAGWTRGRLKAEQVSRALRLGQKTIRHVAGDIDIGAMVDRAAKPLSEALAASVKTRMNGFDSVDMILMTGGGAYVFADHMKALLGGKPCRIIPNAGKANATGFLLLARDYAGKG